jgi:(p)ppGpp synthase/HD superfamily hydrolase
MDNLELIRKALIIMISGHYGQKDKAREAYFYHPITVATMLQHCQMEVIVTALLHDVLEDSDYSAEDLKSLGFSHTIIEAVEAMTKENHEAKTSYLMRVKQNPIALKVKAADAYHNSDITRFDHPTDIERKRCFEYKELHLELMVHIHLSEPDFALHPYQNTPKMNPWFNDLIHELIQD